MPKNWLGTYAFRDKWSMIQINSIYGGNTQLVQSYSLQGDTIYSPLASYFLTLDELKKNKKNIFLYEYNGDKLSKVDGSEIVFLENERPVFKAILN
ncbi:hypothetical protein [Cohnella rhizosphaerae]|uniref:Uncharacterized protein n=1 Tax=Cohnella rhizosphaerae TaxID=1457232 RepID=A0A9X4KVT2_9BACL|nr:hypothetical protein [Cohnella rhizosphaerae]MDG0811817.1 hypothetical protein [Cohnella rhizosphaerae]